MHTRATTTVMLGIAQTLAWASSYYLPAVLANSIASDLDTPPSKALWVSGSLGLSACIALAVLSGRLRRNARP